MDEPSLVFEVADFVSAPMELRETVAQCVRIKNLMPDVMAPCDVDGRFKKVRRTVRPSAPRSKAINETANGLEQRSPGRSFEFTPDLVRASRELDVLIAFPYGQPRDARVAM